MQQVLNAADAVDAPRGCDERLDLLLALHLAAEIDDPALRVDVHGPLRRLPSAEDLGAHPVGELRVIRRRAFRLGAMAYTVQDSPGAVPRADRRGLGHA